VPIAVTTKVSATGPAYTSAGALITLTGTVTAARAATVTRDAWNGSSWTPVASTTSAATGIARFPLTAGTAGTYTYRMRVTGDTRGADGVSSNLVVTVR
jgi:hypothetical protein